MCNILVLVVVRRLCVLLQLEQEFETAANEYEHYNNTMKTELPQFMALATQFIDPLFHSYYYMQFVPFVFTFGFIVFTLTSTQIKHILYNGGETTSFR